MEPGYRIINEPDVRNYTITNFTSIYISHEVCIISYDVHGNYIGRRVCNTTEVLCGSSGN